MIGGSAMRTRWVAAAAAAVLAGVVTGCSADRSGTMVGPAITIEVDGCVPTAAATTVTWSGLSTASVRVSYLQAGKSLASAWVNVSAATNGTVTVAAPTGVDGTWLVDTVSLASRKNGGGTVTDRGLDCAATTGTSTTEGMVTIATAPPTTEGMVTIATAPPTTTK